MTSNKPYLVRALYDWISDNELSPHLLVDAAMAGVRVPSSAVRDGRVVLNITARAVSRLEMDLEGVRFLARFGGVSQTVDVPIDAVLAIYARENGQGMMFQSDESPDPDPATPDKDTGSAMAKQPRLRIVK